GVAIERLFQRGDDDAGETRFESAVRSAGRRLEILAEIGLTRATASASREFGKSDRGLEKAQPGHRHRLGPHPDVLDRLEDAKWQLRPHRCHGQIMTAISASDRETPAAGRSARPS